MNGWIQTNQRLKNDLLEPSNGLFYLKNAGICCVSDSETHPCLHTTISLLSFPPWTHPKSPRPGSATHYVQILGQVSSVPLRLKSVICTIGSLTAPQERCKAPKEITQCKLSLSEGDYYDDLISSPLLDSPLWRPTRLSSCPSSQARVFREAVGTREFRVGPASPAGCGHLACTRTPQRPGCAPEPATPPRAPSPPSVDPD